MMGSMERLSSPGVISDGCAGISILDHITYRFDVNKHDSLWTRSQFHVWLIAEDVLSTIKPLAHSFHLTFRNGASL